MYNFYNCNCVFHCNNGIRGTSHSHLLRVSLSSYPTLSFLSPLVQWRRIYSSNPFLFLPFSPSYPFFSSSVSLPPISPLGEISNLLPRRECRSVCLRSCKDGSSPKGVASDNCLGRALNEQEGGIWGSGLHQPHRPRPTSTTLTCPNKTWSSNLTWSTWSTPPNLTSLNHNNLIDLPNSITQQPTQLTSQTPCNFTQSPSILTWWPNLGWPDRKTVDDDCIREKECTWASGITIGRGPPTSRTSPCFVFTSPTSL